jgi:5'-3' exonuclease
MGVRHLNQFLMKHCPRGMQNITFEHLRGKLIVVDISIYLYKFKGFDDLLNLIRNMLSILQYHDIRAIFVFDGKPKQNKKNELIKRQKNKDVAWEKYTKLENTNSVTATLLKRQFTKINIVDIANVKEIMDSLGVTYIVAPFEADEVCAKLMLTQKVYACMSDDMDMLVHGCSHVLINVNFETKTATLYKLDVILHYLGMTYLEFKQFCIISGTDYYTTNKSLFSNIQLYKKYKDSSSLDFYDWLKENKFKENYDMLETICHDFDVESEGFEYLDAIVNDVSIKCK